MVSIIYHRLFNLQIAHTFYADGLAKGVSIVPTVETSALLASGNMLFKTLPHQTVVLFRGEDDDPANPFVDLGDDFKMVFALKVNNRSEFINITNLDTAAKDYASGDFLYFKNDPSQPSPETIAHELLHSVRTNLFTYTFALAGGTGAVEFRLFRINDDGSETLVSSGKDVLGNPLPDIILLQQNPDNDSYSHSVDLRGKTNGRYRIDIQPNGGGALLHEELTYVHPGLAGTDAVGVVEIVYDAVGKAYDSTEDYILGFDVKSTKWKYHIVDKSGKFTFPDDNMKIDHGDFPDPPGGTGPHPTIQINNKPTVIITSDNAIAFTESPILNIELQRESDDETFVEHLPNPALYRNVKKEGSDLISEIYVFI